MHLFKSSAEYARQSQDPAVVTLGNFDGVHIGHQALIRSAEARARELKLSSLVYTFAPHPRKVLRGGTDSVPLILTDAEREKRLASLNVNALVIEPFDEQFQLIPAEEFVRSILVGRLRAAAVICGPDFKFGRDGLGSVALLKSLGGSLNFDLLPLPTVEVRGERVSSSRIRHAILNGDVELAAECLGRAFSLTGEVVHGYQRGKTLGFPTANLYTLKELIPKGSVYVTDVSWRDQTYRSVTNIGTSPTFAGSQKRIEVHLLDFDHEIYGETLALHFLARLRDERRFPSVDALRAQIELDVQKARQFRSLI